MAVRASIVSVRRRAFNSKYYSDAFREGNRTAFNEWGQRMAAGFNSIVSDWDDKPSFNKRVVMPKASKRVFVTIQIRGTKEAKDHFRWLDKGAKRGQRIQIEGIELPFKKVLQLPGPGKGQAYSYEASKTITRITDEVREQYTVKIGPKMQLALRLAKEARAAGRETRKRDKRMPMRRYTSKTTPRTIGRASKYEEPESYLYETNLGPIKARKWSEGAAAAAVGKRTATSFIFTRQGDMSWARAVRLGYERGRRAARRSSPK